MDRVASWTSPGDVHGLLGNAALEHVDMLVHKGSSIYSTMNMKSGIDNALPSATDPLLQSLMKLDDSGGFFRQADMEQSLLFAIRARGSERWCAQGHDIAVSYEIRVMLSHRQKMGFTAMANTRKTSVERASRPHPFIAFRNNAEDDVSEDVPICCRIWDGEESHGMRMATASLPTRTAKRCFRDCCLAQGGYSRLATGSSSNLDCGRHDPKARGSLCNQHVTSLHLFSVDSSLLVQSSGCWMICTVQLFDDRFCLTFNQSSLEFVCVFQTSNRCHVKSPKVMVH